MRWIERFFLTVGFVILGYCGAEWIHSRVQQTRGNHELDRLLGKKVNPAPAARPRIPEGDLVGRIEIPRLRVSAVIFQGTNNHILSEGVGHLDQSALPGQPGNVVLAAHRDTFFRSLRNIREGDRVQVETPYGARTYTVDSTRIVNPTEVSVMAPTPAPTLTLITCYPFNYIGHAPERFIVRAHDTEYQAPRLMARNSIPDAVVNNRLSDEDTANLTYIFKASEAPETSD